MCQYNWSANSHFSENYTFTLKKFYFIAKATLFYLLDDISLRIIFKMWLSGKKLTWAQNVWCTSGQPVPRTECLRGRPFPPSTEVITFYCKSAGSTVNSVDHWLPHCWVDPLTVDCWLSITSLLTVDPLTVDCWSSISSLLTIDPLTVDCWSSITSLLTIDPLTVDCWSSPPGSTVSVDCQLPHYWLLTLSLLTVDHWSLTLSLLTVDPPRINSQ